VAATERARPAYGRAQYIAIALGALLGGYLRLGLAATSLAGSASSWPWATFAVNVAGTVVLAFTVAFLAVRASRARLLRPFLATGVAGTLTTFSTLQLEVFRMFRAGHVPLGLGYLAATLAAGAFAFALGGAIARRCSR
jgi:CrcB protein